MKMKRLFPAKSKKKKSTAGDVVINECISANPDNKSAIPSPTEEHETKFASKKRLRFRKHKNKSKKPLDTKTTAAPSESNSSQPYYTPGCPNVVMRRNLKDESQGNQKHSEKRIPGSVSSSRTVSSASSSSSSRWSSRRPWSLIEWMQASTLTEFAEQAEFSDRNECERVPVSRPKTIIVLQKSASEKEAASHQETDSHGRNLHIDLSFLRRFKRSSYNVGIDTSESSASSPSSSVGDERLSFRMKNSNRQKTSKKNRSSWHESSISHSSTSALAPSLSTPGNNMNMRSWRSGLEQSGFKSVEDVITEGKACLQGSAPTSLPRGTSDSSGSRSSVSTVISATESASKCSSRISDHHGIENLNRASYHSTCSDKDATSCSKFGNPKAGFRRSVGYCTSLPVEDELTASQHSALSFASSRDELENSHANAKFHISPKHSAELGYNRLMKATTKYGGSLINLPSTCCTKWDVDDESTLTRRSVRKSNKFRLQSAHNSAVYASSPQLCDESCRVSGKLKEHSKSPKAHRNSPAVSNHDNPVVDSPIKRAIGFPGVVLRRRHLFKQTSGYEVTKSASSDLLSRKKRSKQVMSLNMEDLPTYIMREDSLSGSEAGNRMSTEEYGREISRAAILYQRYLSHSTSFDDVADLNLDEESILNFLLSESEPGSTLDRNGNKTHQTQEPSSKRVKTLRKSVVSFASLISPGKQTRGKVQRSSSYKEYTAPPCKPYRPPGSNSTGGGTGSGGSNSTSGKRSSGNSAKNRGSKLWSETFDYSGLDGEELKRQEAIYELYQGERVMVQDLKMAKQTYRDSMMTLKMLSEDEVTRIFGTLDCLLPLHEDLLTRLEAERSEDGRTEGVGDVFNEWLPTLTPYNEYCANQADAKETLDAVVNREARVRDFLQRCLESPFSRKLDLWSYLDLPRSRLVKYPLLLKAIHKVTPQDHRDAATLEKSLSMINDIITRVDHLTGERQCRFVQSKLEYLDKKKCSEVEKSRKIICSGQLKTSRGTKVQVFLFDRALVLTRNATRGEKLTYQVHRQPLPLKTASIETDEGGKLSGSFRGGILSGDKTLKHAFRVKSDQLNIGYTLCAVDEHDKKQWINSIQEAITNCQTSSEPESLKKSENPVSALASLIKIEKRNHFVKRSSSNTSDSSQSTDSSDVSQLTARHKDGKDMKKSPLRRRSKDKEPIAEVVKVAPKNEETESEKQVCRRTRSLTASPVVSASIPDRRRSTAGFPSESFLKPPSGKPTSSTPTHQNNLRSNSRTPPRSPRLSSTRSMSDLYCYIRRRSQELKHDEEHSSTDLPTIVAESTVPLSPLQKHRLSSVSHLIIDSPDHPAASNTSQNFPMVEEDSIKPDFKSLTTMHASAASPTISIAFPPLLPIATWPATTQVGKRTVSTSSKSSESLSDEPLAVDDVDLILEGVASSDNDVTFSHGAMTSSDISGDVGDVLNDILEQICSSRSGVLVSCNEHFITIASDDGTPWRGDDMEVSV